MFVIFVENYKSFIYHLFFNLQYMLISPSLLCVTHDNLHSTVFCFSLTSATKLLIFSLYFVVVLFVFRAVYGGVRRRVGLQSLQDGHSDGVAASELTPEGRRCRCSAAMQLLQPAEPFPPRRPVRRGLEGPAVGDWFRALPPLWSQWQWRSAQDKGDGEFSGAVGCKGTITSKILRRTEHKKFGFEFGNLRPMKYEQIAKLLNGIAERFDWDKIMEDDKIIGLKRVCEVSLRMENKHRGNVTEVK
ncbi:unnamed protein product [Sphenostylis stenocarpa]|uniref:Uncharacterized protein n=1 Tax=Sphenostylis stenocarpa TaxID=92480 RepID=A0AA86VAS9_9FABA|nr:unnamed protein product [Sphenostylis stenocarpa]